MAETYLEVTQEAGATFFSKGITGPIVMLNLMRFKDVADYSTYSELAPADPISGREAYEAYMAQTRPFLEESGGEVLFAGEAHNFLIGPQEEAWDYVLLVKHKSPQTFMAFAQNPDYLPALGHRQAAVEDSRLLPITELDQS